MKTTYKKIFFVFYRNRWTEDETGVDTNARGERTKREARVQLWARGYATLFRQVVQGWKRVLSIPAPGFASGRGFHASRCHRWCKLTSLPTKISNFDTLGGCTKYRLQINVRRTGKVQSVWKSQISGLINPKFKSIRPAPFQIKTHSTKSNLTYNFWKGAFNSETSILKILKCLVYTRLISRANHPRVQKPEIAR